MNIYKLLNKNIKTVFVSATPKIFKNVNYGSFINDNTCVQIICNVHIPDEGIYIPSCDSVYLTHPNNNTTNIIQRISRCNRINKNNPNKIGNEFIWSLIIHIWNY